MPDVTQLLKQISDGNVAATDELLPLVYEELREMALRRLRHRDPNHSLQSTELVHEVYLRLVRPGECPEWDGRGHFFSAAAEAMRRIIVDRIRKKLSEKRGGKLQRSALEEVSWQRSRRALSVHEALEALESKDKQAATLVKLRYFVGMNHQEAAEVMGLTRRQGDRLWLSAKTWLYGQLNESD